MRPGHTSNIILDMRPARACAVNGLGVVYTFDASESGGLNV